MITVKRIIVLFSFLYALYFLLLIFPSCKEHKEYKWNKTYAAIPQSSIKKDADLAEQYCKSCHALPDPALLDAATWD